MYANEYSNNGSSFIAVLFLLIGIVVGIFLFFWVMNEGILTPESLGVNIPESKLEDLENIYIEELSLENSHATERHGTEIETIREFCSRNPLQTWQKIYSNHNRIAKICNIKGWFGIWILEDLENEITGFIRKTKEGGNVTLEQLKHYMKSTGWTCVTGC